MVATGTLQMIDGAETGGLDLVASTAGSPSVGGSIAVPVGRSGGAFHYSCPNNGDIIGLPPGYGSGGTVLSSLAYDHGLVGFNLYFDAFPTTGATSSFRVLGAGGNVVYMTVDSSGVARLLDNAATTLATTSALSVTTIHHFEIAWESVASGGAWEFWLDGSSVSSGSAGAFLTDDITELNFRRSSTSGGGIDFDDVYFVTHTSTLQGNNLGPSEVFAYQGQKASSTSDTGLTTNDTSGPFNWANAGRTPYENFNSQSMIGNPADGAIAFDDADLSYHTGGPDNTVTNTGLYDVSGTIQGAMFYGIYQRGTGGGSTHVQWYGNDSQSPISSFTMDTIANSTDSPRGIVSEAVGPVPLASEYFAMGIGTTGAQDIECYEQWAFLLHTPSAAVDENPYGRPFGLRGAQQMQQLLAT